MSRAIARIRIGKAVILVLVAPPEGGKSITMAGWFFASFAGNLFAGSLGTLWGRIDHAVFFAAMAGLAALSSVLLFWLKGRLE